MLADFPRGATAGRNSCLGPCVLMAEPESEIGVQHGIDERADD